MRASLVADWRAYEHEKTITDATYRGVEDVPQTLNNFVLEVEIGFGSVGTELSPSFPEKAGKLTD